MKAQGAQLPLRLLAANRFKKMRCRNSEKLFGLVES
jgi:hypothetical protein